MCAIMKALDYIAHIEDENIVIYTDSFSSICSIKQLFNANPIVKLIQLNINDMLQKKTILILWIPSHVGITENEKVDRLAKNAANRNPQELNTLLCSDAIKATKKHTQGK